MQCSSGGGASMAASLQQVVYFSRTIGWTQEDEALCLDRNLGLFFIGLANQL
jgi:hypothetical protein